MIPFQELSTAELLSRTASAYREKESLEDEARWALLRELHRRQEAETFRAGAAWSTSEERALRCLSADLLGQLGYEQSYPFATESVPILTRLVGDAEPEVIACAIVALAHLHRGDTGLIAGLATHAVAEVRHAVAVCLGTREEEAATRALLLLSRDEDRDVRDWATFGLGSLQKGDSPAIREALKARLGDSEDDVRGEALVGLARRGDRDSIPAVLAEIRATASVLAIEAAGELADPVFVAELEKLLRENPGDSNITEALDRCRVK